MPTETAPIPIGAESGGGVTSPTDIIPAGSSPAPGLNGQASLSPRQLFELIYAGLEGYLCIAGKRPGGKFTEWFYRYPAELDNAQRELRQYISSNNLYYCAHLLSKPKRDKEHAAKVRALWGDGDTCPPDKLLVPPSIIIESSPGRYQYLWLLDEPIPPQAAEKLCKRIAYYHKPDGFDTSGWDLTQLLRIPNTQNYKYGDRPIVTVLTSDGPANYRPADFAKYPPVADAEPTGASDAPLPDVAKLPPVAALLARDSVPTRVRELFANTPEDERWSHDLAELIWTLLRDAVFAADETFKVAREAACNKFERDGRGDAPLWYEVRKAHAKIEGETANALAEPFFWLERPELTHIRSFARARRANPWAVLGVVLARIIAATHPRLVLPPLIGGTVSLNLFVGLVGEPGAGKDAALRAGKAAVDVGDLFQIQLGSGEGITHLYATAVQEEDEHGKKLQGQMKTVQHRTSVLFVSGEIQTLKAVAERRGSTLMPVVRDTYFGSPLGFGYVEQAKRITLDEHAYRLSLITGIQPGKADILLNDDEVAAGTPQRFLWMPTADPDMPDTKPPCPEPWIWKPPAGVELTHRGSLDGVVIPPRFIEAKVCEMAASAIDQAALDRARGRSGALDGHALLAREKVAAAFALLAGRLDIEESDWYLAGTVMRKSNETRRAVLKKLGDAKVRANQARGKAEAQRAVTVADAVDDAKVTRNLARVSRSILDKLEAHGDWMASAKLRGMVAYRDRQYFEQAIASLVAAGQVDAEAIEGQGEAGMRYRAHKP